MLRAHFSWPANLQETANSMQKQVNQSTKKLICVKKRLYSAVVFIPHYIHISKQFKAAVRFLLLKFISTEGNMNMNVE